MLNSKHPLASKLCEIGIRQGDAVAILSENSREFAELVLACWRLGVVVMPVSTRYPSAAVSKILDDLTVKFLFTSRDFSTQKNHSFCIDDFVEGGGEDWTPAAFDKNDFDLQAEYSVRAGGYMAGVASDVPHQRVFTDHAGMAARRNTCLSDGKTAAY
jgi:acyl-CoA synthetase (AMP-forming)/AMP-acid ligase II